MDPISIISLIASVGSVADIVARSIDKLSRFKTKYREAPFVVAVLMGQLCTTQTALGQLRTWAEDHLDADPRYEDLTAQVYNALTSFNPLITNLYAHLDIHDIEERKSLPIKKRLSFIWNERDLNAYFQMLDCQVNALTLLLQAVQCKTWSEQREMLAAPDNDSILSSARDCSTSVFAMPYAMSVYSQDNISETADIVSQTFDFDQTLIQSRVYTVAYRLKPQRLISQSSSEHAVSADGRTGLAMSENGSVSANSQPVPRQVLSTDKMFKHMIHDSDIHDRNIQRYSIIENALCKLLPSGTSETYDLVCRDYHDSAREREDLREMQRQTIHSVSIWGDTGSGERSIFSSNLDTFNLYNPLVSVLAWLAEEFRIYLTNCTSLTSTYYPHFDNGQGAWLQLVGREHGDVNRTMKLYLQMHVNPRDLSKRIFYYEAPVWGTEPFGTTI